jgi:hypothetical protein
LPITEAITIKTKNKPYETKNAASKIHQILQLVFCLIESLYLNPLWRSPETVTQEKIMIANHALFLKCKNSVDVLYSTSLTEMMKNISLN